MDPAHLLVVSDTHLSPRAPEAASNWEAVLAHAAATGPDLVVHLGDLTLDGSGDPQELDGARRELDRLDAPWLAIPGNHDIGDNVLEVPDGRPEVTQARRGAWVEAIGEDWWERRLGGWTLLGLDAQLFGSGLAAEAEQWAFLERAIDRLGSGRLVLLTHKPLIAGEPELETAPPARFWPPEARQHLDALVGRQLELVVSGHVHQGRTLKMAGRTHVWAPTTWAVLPDEIQPLLGDKRVGVLAVELGASSPHHALVEPDGVRQLTLGREVRDPYHHQHH